MLRSCRPLLKKERVPKHPFLIVRTSSKLKLLLLCSVKKTCRWHVFSVSRSGYAARATDLTSKSLPIFQSLSPHDSGTGNGHQGQTDVHSNTGVEGRRPKRRLRREERDLRKERHGYRAPTGMVAVLPRRGALRKPRFRRVCAAGCNPARGVLALGKSLLE